MFLHIDIDCFFVSAERSYNSKLQGIPVAVGSRSNVEIFSTKRQNIKLFNQNSGAFVTPVFYTKHQETFKQKFIDTINGEEKIRGIITTASYEARALGVKTAMPIARALKLCPHLLVIPSNYKRYHDISHRLFSFMQARIPLVEQYSIDEFFCNISGWVKPKDALGFAYDLQQEILERFNLPVSIGIAKSKWIAKLATEDAKPMGIFEVRDVQSYIEHKPIEVFPGIGKGFATRLHTYHIQTLGELSRNKKLLYSWKKPGRKLYCRVTGTDQENISNKSPQKSIGISRTFDVIYDKKELKRRIMVMARHIVYMTTRQKLNPTLYYLKIGYEYKVRAKKTVRINRLFNERLYKSTLLFLLEEIHQPFKGAIKLTLTVSHFSSQFHTTLCLLKYEEDKKHNDLSTSIHKARERFGLDILKSANEL